MGGGVIQLVAYGDQDIHITGNPHITFFKKVHKRHTHFAIERFQQYPIGTINWGNRLVFEIQRKADLLGKCYIDFVLEFYHNTTTKLTFDEVRQHLISNKINNAISKSIGYSFIDMIEIEIGGTIIDTQTGHWMAIKSELKKNFNERLKNIFITGGFYRASHISEHAIYFSIPLHFWFNENPGLYLPLVALQHHDVKINLKLNPLNKILLNSTNTGGGSNNNNHTISDIKIIELDLFCDYVYLDTDERKQFAKKSHEYLIEQLQVLPGEFCNSSHQVSIIPLIFNHPIKEIIWTLQDKRNNEILGPLWSEQKDRIKGVKLHLNGTSRFMDDTPGIYFQTIQHYQHHNGIDLEKLLIELCGFMEGQVKKISNSGLGMEIVGPTASLDPFIYSFCLEPDNHQPSGTCNFSRLDNPVLTLTINQTYPTLNNDGLDIKIYGVNYNVLRIMKGMGGLAYSN